MSTEVVTGAASLPERIDVRLSFEAPIAPPELVRALHGFIQRRALAGKDVMVDVIDYAHVVGGPGVLLVCHFTQYALGAQDGRFSLTGARKRGATGSLAERVRSAIADVLSVARLLETEAELAGRVRPDTRALRVSFPDKLATPNDAATLARLRPEVERVLRELWDGAVTLEDDASDARSPLAFRATFEAAPSVAQLLDRARPS